MGEKNEKYDVVISSYRGWLDINFRELLHYRDLILMFVRRDFVAGYKQTVLGPAWAILRPLFTTVVYTLIFGHMAKLSTHGIPPFLFYMCGNLAWGYFSGCFSGTSSIFLSHSHIMGKVYFPRLVMPIAAVIYNLINFAIQFVFFISMLGYYSWAAGELSINATIWELPFLLLNMALLGLACGIIVSSLTIKYRDLGMLLGAMIQAWLYLTPVVYTIEEIPERWRFLYMCNPMATVIEHFRGMFFVSSKFSIWNDVIGWGITLVILFFGVLLFNRMEKDFIDKV